jgi:hypothetical protein
MTARTDIKFQDNAAALARPESFVSIEVETARVLKSWKASLYSFEWLNTDGSIKSLEELSGTEAAKRLNVESDISAGKPIEKPLLGIGVMDNVEIGSGRAQFLTLAAQGMKIIPVHIPASNKKDFKPFLANPTKGL